MLDPDGFFTWDFGANKAIARLCPAIDEALESGSPVRVRCHPATYAGKEFAKLAVDLCARAEVNVAVLVTGENTISLVPLVVQVIQLTRRRGPRMLEAPAIESVSVTI